MLFHSFSQACFFHGQREQSVQRYQNWHPLGCAHWTCTSTDPRKNTLLTTPLLKAPYSATRRLTDLGLLHPCSYRLLFARLLLPALPCQCLRSPNLCLLKHSRSAEHALQALPWSLRLKSTSQPGEGKENASPATIRCSTDLPSPGTALALQPSQVPGPPAHREAQITLGAKRCLSRARGSKPSQDRPRAMSTSK